MAGGGEMSRTTEDDFLCFDLSNWGCHFEMRDS